MWLFYTAFAANVPFLFELTKRNRADQFIGNLSYPIYIIHNPLIVMWNAFHGEPLSSQPSLGAAVFLVAVVIILAASAHYYIERPINHFRARLKDHG